MEKEKEGLQSEVIQLRQLFEGGKQQLRTTNTKSAAGSLDETMKRYAEFDEKIKEYVATCVKNGRALGIKMQGLHKPDLLERAYKLVPIVGNKLATSRFKHRLDQQSLDENLNTMLDNCEYYSQAVELARTDLAKEVVDLENLQKELLQRQKDANKGVNETTPKFLEAKTKIGELEQQLEGKSQTEKLVIEEQLLTLRKTKDDLEEQIGTYTFQAKCAQENFEYSQGIKENLQSQVKTLKYQGVILHTVATDSAKNVQSLAKLLASVKTGASAVQVYDIMGDTLNSGIELAGKATKSLAAETSRMLTEDMYDANKIQTSIADAREAARILQDAVATAYEKFTQKA